MTCAEIRALPQKSVADFPGTAPGSQGAPRLRQGYGEVSPSFDLFIVGPNESGGARLSGTPLRACPPPKCRACPNRSSRSTPNRASRCVDGWASNDRGELGKTHPEEHAGRYQRHNIDHPIRLETWSGRYIVERDDAHDDHRYRPEVGRASHVLFLRTQYIPQDFSARLRSRPRRNSPPGSKRTVIARSPFEIEIENYPHSFCSHRPCWITARGAPRSRQGRGGLPR